MENKIRPSETADMYLRLGIRKGATHDEVKEAYRKAALYWHPDKNTDKEMSHIEFIAVSEAFEKLSKKFEDGPNNDFDYQDFPEKKKTYEYYDKLFREIFEEDSEYTKNMSREFRTIIEIFKKFRI